MWNRTDTPYQLWRKQFIINERMRKLNDICFTHNPIPLNAELLVVRDSSIVVANELFKKKFKNNSMRNKRCPCKSGKKFKFCCWDKYPMIHSFIKGD